MGIEVGNTYKRINSLYDKGTHTIIDLQGGIIVTKGGSCPHWTSTFFKKHFELVSNGKVLDLTKVY